VELEVGKVGQFDVVAHPEQKDAERLVFSKHKTGRFPEDDEVIGPLVGGQTA
jgi:hypothetical protein